MASSGTYGFTLQIAEVIDEAFERCGIDPQTVEGYKVKSARRSMNLLFADWSVKGINFWATEEVTLTLTQGVKEYQLPVGTLDILDAVIRRDGQDIECDRVALADYHSLPTKDDQGRPTKYFFDRQITPNIFLWQVPENSTDQFVYWRVKQIEDVTAANQDPNIPYRWTEALCAGMAAKLAVKYSPEKLDMLKALAFESFENAADDENERATLKIIPASVV